GLGGGWFGLVPQRLSSSLAGKLAIVIHSIGLYESQQIPRGFRGRFSPAADCAGALFATDGGGGVYLHGAASGDVAGGKRDEEEQRGDGGEGGRVGRLDAIEVMREKASNAGRGGDAERDTGGCEEHAAPNDETQEIAAARAEGDADADLARAARDFIGEQAVEADGSEQ